MDSTEPPDIVDRLRSWTIAPVAPPASDLMDEAADEIARLRELRSLDGEAMSSLILGYRKMQGLCIDGKYLTDEERAAIQGCIDSHSYDPMDAELLAVAAVLKGLLKRFTV